METRKTLQYVILAGLAHEPRSGYDITRWLSLVASHFWLVGHSSIYPALASLEEESLVTHEEAPSERGPKRKVYDLTEKGFEVLLSWVDGPAAEQQVRDEQLVKALCYGFLREESALARVDQVRQHHAEKLVYYESLERRLESGLGPREGETPITGAAYAGTLLALRRGIGNEQSYLEWCDEAEEIISSASGNHRRNDPSSRAG